MAKGTVLFYLINEVSVHSCTNTSFPTNGVPVKNLISHLRKKGLKFGILGG